ncbi:MAG: MGMT family protein [Candidatus Aenigmatarchaeota archaeon]
MRHKDLTDLRQKVFSAVLKIPKGKVATYKQIAQICGTSPRAVGKILNSNERLVKIPCHRAVMSSGRIGGYKGGVLEKARLLESEGVEVKGWKVDLAGFGWKKRPKGYK